MAPVYHAHRYHPLHNFRCLTPTITNLWHVDMCVRSRDQCVTHAILPLAEAEGYG
jgi:hypothetical protein